MTESIHEIIERLNGLGNMSDEERAEAAATMEKLLAVHEAAEHVVAIYDDRYHGIANLKEKLDLVQTRRDKAQSS